jgi:endonuclease YncB( thermonuclease family)
MKKLFIAILFLTTVISYGRTYKLTNVSVYDGDTVYADIQLGFKLQLTHVKIRLSGIDTPEIRTKNDIEKKAGLLVRDYVADIIKNHKNNLLLVTDDNQERDKYGRVLGSVYYDFAKSITSLLIENKLAIPYGIKYKQEDYKRIIETLSRKENEK